MTGLQQALRAARPRKLEEISTRCGVRLGSVRGWAEGEDTTNVAPWIWIAVAEILGVPLDRLR